MDPDQLALKPADLDLLSCPIEGQNYSKKFCAQPICKVKYGIKIFQFRYAL